VSPSPTDTAAGRTAAAAPARAASTDPRAERVRVALIQAGFDVLMERPIGDIAVPDIVARAQVSRPVFYRHFTDRDDLVVAALVQRMDEAVSAAVDAADAVRLVLRWADRHRVLYANIHPSYAAQQVSGHLREIIRPWCRELAEAQRPRRDPPDLRDHEQFLVGGVLELVRASASSVPVQRIDADRVMRLTAALIS
jgi:AcrR family transcriptional regulator